VSPVEASGQQAMTSSIQKGAQVKCNSVLFHQAASAQSG
jgi:hypothetical protein